MKKILLLLLIPILSFSQNCVPTTIIINLDQYQSETSWGIYDTSGALITYGQNYSGYPDFAIVNEQRCLPEGPLLFEIYDSYGDGLQGSLWGGLDGSYYLIQCNDTLVFGDDAAYGLDTAHAFGSDACPPVMGCMDPSYIEFDPLADTDDGSCNTLKIFGCTDPTMFNFDATANTMDLIPNCDYILTLYDLVGDGWVGSQLEVKQDTNYWYYSLDTALFENDYIINLQSPKPVTFKFEVSQQAALTASHCGFKLTNPDGVVLKEVLPPFINPGFTHVSQTYCGNLCIEKIYGCTYATAVNYDSLANTDDVSCYYNPGCTNPVYLEYNANYDYDDGSCGVLVALGCMDSTAFNYDPLANTELTGSCIAVVEGCMQPLAFNYNPNANVADTCIALTYGCTDAMMFNYDINANTDDGGCEPFVFGCTDSTQFNYDPLANTDNTSCIPFVLGCTDPSMLNYNVAANTEDFSCIAYIYGCMDELALNYNAFANTDNNSCIEIVIGCMDPGAYSYEPNANVGDSLACLYNAGCITGPGNPYWLNDDCYSWVISVDDYCCENEWDEICQLTYNYCNGTWSGPIVKRVYKKELIKITDLLGRKVKQSNNKLLLYIYSDGSVERKLIKQ